MPFTIPKSNGRIQKKELTVQSVPVLSSTYSAEQASADTSMYDINVNKITNGTLTTNINLNNLNYLSSTPGNTAVNKAVVADSNLNVGILNNVSCQSLTIKGQSLANAVLDASNASSLLLSSITNGVAKENKVLVTNSNNSVNNLNTVDCNILSSDSLYLTGNNIFIPKLKSNLYNVPNNLQINDICYSLYYDMTIAVGNNGYLYSSTNGIDWTSTTVGSNNWTVIKWFPNSFKFIMISDNSSNNFAISDDGINWTISTLSVIPSNVEMANGKIVIVSENTTTNILVSSNNGTSFSSATITTSKTNMKLKDICYVSKFNTFITVGSYGTGALTSQNGLILKSSDGSTWTESLIVGSYTMNYGSVCTDGNNIYAIRNYKSHLLDGYDVSKSSDGGVSFTYKNGTIAPANRIFLNVLVKKAIYVEDIKQFVLVIIMNVKNILYTYSSIAFTIDFLYTLSPGDVDIRTPITSLCWNYKSGKFIFASRNERLEDITSQLYPYQSLLKIPYNYMNGNNIVGVYYLNNMTIVLPGTYMILYSTDHSTFTPCTFVTSVSNMTNYFVNSICYSSSLNLFIACYNNQNTNLIKSTDGINWNVISTSPTASYVKVIFMDNIGKFVAFTNNLNSIYTSSDGSSWTNTTSNTSAFSISEAIYIPELNKAFASYYGSNSIFYTTNGTTWSSYSTSSVPKQIRYYNSKLYAIFSGNDLKSSSDQGSTWSVVRSSTGAGLSSLAIDQNTGNIVVGTNNTSIYSVETLNSNTITDITTTSINYSFILWHPVLNRFVYMSNSGYRLSQEYKSKLITSDSIYNNRNDDIIYIKNRMKTNLMNIYSSLTKDTNSFTLFDSAGTISKLFIENGENRIVLITNGSTTNTNLQGFQFNSSGPITTITSGTASNVTVNDICYSQHMDTYYFACSSSTNGTNRIYRSSNAISGMTAISSTTLGNYVSICIGKNLIVAVGSDGYITSFYSTAGEIGTGSIGYNINTIQFQSKVFNSVAFGNNKFVAVGSSGVCMYSDDGKIWNSPITSISNTYTFNSIAFGNNKFIAVGNSGVSMYSIDGINWNSPITINSNNHIRIKYIKEPEVFVSMSSGSNNKISLTYNGIDWIDCDINSSNINIADIGYFKWYGSLCVICSSGTNRLIFTNPIIRTTYNSYMNYLPINSDNKLSFLNSIYKSNLYDYRLEIGRFGFYSQNNAYYASQENTTIPNSSLPYLMHNGNYLQFNIKNTNNNAKIIYNGSELNTSFSTLNKLSTITLGSAQVSNFLSLDSLKNVNNINDLSVNQLNISTNLSNKSNQPLCVDSNKSIFDMNHIQMNSIVMQNNNINIYKSKQLDNRDSITLQPKIVNSLFSKLGVNKFMIRPFDSQFNMVNYIKELNMFIAMAAGSFSNKYFLYSYDLQNWYYSNVSSTGNQFFYMGYSPSLDMLVAGVNGGSGPLFKYSTDRGMNWTNSTTQGSDQIRRIRWINNRNVFVASTAGSNIYVSSDGTNWTSYSTSGMTNIIAYSPTLDIFMTTNGSASTTNLHKSSNYSTWTTTTKSNTEVCYNIIWDHLNSRFIAIGNNSYNIFVSSDGSTFTTIDLSSYMTNKFITNRYYDISYVTYLNAYCFINGHEIIMLGASNSISRYVLREDFTNYYFIDRPNKLSIISLHSSSFNHTPDYNGVYIVELLDENNSFVNKTSDKRIMSKFIKSNEIFSLIETQKNYLCPVYSWQDTVYGYENKICISVGTDRIMKSSNVLDWNDYEIIGNWKSIAYSENIFVAISDDKIIYSQTGTDANSWNQITITDLNISTTFKQIIYNEYNSTTYIVGTDYVLYSSDCINWTSVYKQGNWISITCNQDKIVIMKSNGISSSNSSSLSSWNDSYIYGICNYIYYANGKYIICKNMEIAYSYDLIKWQTQQLGGNYIKIKYFYQFNYFIALSNSGINRFLLSHDCINWYSKTYPVNNNWTTFELDEKNAVFYILSNNGTNRFACTPQLYATNSNCVITSMDNIKYATNNDSIILGAPNTTTTSPITGLYLYSDSAGKPASSSWSSVSDERLKEEIQPADLDICYDNVKKLKLVEYNWTDEYLKQTNISNSKKLGWIAQDVETILPKAIKETNMFGYEDFKTINTDQLITNLYGAVKKLISIVEENDNKIKKKFPNQLQ